MHETHYAWNATHGVMLHAVRDATTKHIICWCDDAPLAGTIARELDRCTHSKARRLFQWFRSFSPLPRRLQLPLRKTKPLSGHSQKNSQTPSDSSPMRRSTGT